jgi:photosystem II stability/assembly factor-like uncharacterized protein
VSCSADGQYVLALAGGQQIRVYHGGWSARESARIWRAGAVSADGSVMVAVDGQPGFIYVSTDYGVNWMPTGITGDWYSAACSADGTRMIVGGANTGVYISQDSGNTWQKRGNLPDGASPFFGVASSDDGSTMAAAAAGAGLFVSSRPSTTVGTAGQLIGSRLAAVELQHVGGGVFMPISFVGTIRAK